MQFLDVLFRKEKNYLANVGFPPEYGPDWYTLVGGDLDPAHLILHLLHLDVEVCGIVDHEVGGERHYLGETGAALADLYPDRGVYFPKIWYY